MTETQISAEKLQKKIKDLEELLEVSLYLNSTLDLDTVLQHILHSSKRILNVEAVSILLLDKKTGELFFRSALGGNSEAIVPYRLKPGEGIAGFVVESRKPILVENAQTDPRFARRFDTLSGFTTQSLLAVPMFCKEEIIGVIELMNKISDDGKIENFSRDDLEKSTFVANMAAAALENARLYQELQKSYAEMQKVEKSKEEFISVISHELRTPLVPINGYAHLLRTQRSKLPEEAQNEFLDEILRQAEHLNLLIEDLFLANDVDGAHFMIQASPTPFFKLIQDAISIKKINSQTHPIEISIEPNLQENGEPTLQVDAPKFVHLLVHLLDNAVKFSPGGGKILVSLSAQENQVLVCIQDEGIGVPEEFREKIFQRFFQVDSSTTRRFGGTGIGLFIVKKIAEAHGGDVACFPSTPKGTKIVVFLPKQVLFQKVH
jgi:signal transduction histidine kinase